MACINCRTPFPKGARFCSNCGSSNSRINVQPSAPPASQVNFGPPPSYSQSTQRQLAATLVSKPSTICPACNVQMLILTKANYQCPRCKGYHTISSPPSMQQQQQHQQHQYQRMYVQGMGQTLNPTMDPLINFEQITTAGAASSVPTDIRGVVSCYACSKQFRMAFGLSQSRCPNCNAINGLPGSGSPNPAPDFISDPLSATFSSLQRMLQPPANHGTYFPEYSPSTQK